MENNTGTQLYLPALAEYRKAAAWRRAAAFVPGPDNVCGLLCRPMTPATYSQLFALRSRFITGGQPGEGDVRNYLWIHSPQFVPGDSPSAKRTRARVLRPFERLTMKRWLGVLRRPDEDTYCAAVALAINDIIRLVEDAFADEAAGGSWRPVRATLEAQMIALFADAYGWTPERTSSTPIKQLYQLVTLINGTDTPDAGEAAIIEAHLRKLNNALAGEREKQKQEATANA